MSLISDIIRNIDTLTRLTRVPHTSLQHNNSRENRDLAHTYNKQFTNTHKPEATTITLTTTLDKHELNTHEITHCNTSNFLYNTNITYKYTHVNQPFTQSVDHTGHSTPTPKILNQIWKIHISYPWQGYNSGNPNVSYLHCTSLHIQRELDVIYINVSLLYMHLRNIMITTLSKSNQMVMSSNGIHKEITNYDFYLHTNTLE